MSANAIHESLLRPPVLHILRAAGFQAARPAALDTVVDLTHRYIKRLASLAASHAVATHNELTLTLPDLRLAMQDLGTFGPQIGSMEEQCRDEEDLRGVDAFISWAKGENNREIRRIAGLAASEGEVVEIEASLREDFLTVLKKKHSKTGEESRYQGTVIGKPADEESLRVDGGPIESIEDWEAKLRARDLLIIVNPIRQSSSPPLSSVGSPLTDV